MTACVLDWGFLANWLAALAAAGTLGVAIWAARSWREQLRGGSKHGVAQEVATAARALRYSFYGARSPLIEGWEFPEAYWNRDPLEQRSNSEEADAYRHVYHRRMQELWPNIKVIADLRARAGAVLGEEVATDLENLAKKARQLDFFFQQDVDQRRAGSEAVKRWTDQGSVARVKQGVVVHDPPDDRFSQEFEELLRALLERVEPHI